MASIRESHFSTKERQMADSLAHGVMKNEMFGSLAVLYMTINENREQ